MDINLPNKKEAADLPLASKPAEATPEIAEPQEHTEPRQNQEVLDQTTLRQEIEAMDVDDDLKPQVSQAASDLKNAAPDEKIKKLLLVAEQKGVVYAVTVAKKMDDPYVLDMLHDALAAQGHYKKFKP